MPFYATQYHGEFQIKDGDICDIYIYDRETESETPVDETIISLNDANGKLPEDCLKIITDTIEEDKFKDVIRHKRAEIKFFSSIGVSMATFAAGEDNRWYVVITIRGKYTLFIGHLNQDDIREPFLDPEINTVTLTAVDGLKALYTIPLTKPDGTNPRGINRIIEYIHWCLLKTGLNLLIYSMNNVRPYYTTEQMYQKNYIEAKSWEEEINESISCGEVLEKILGYNSFLSQRDGKWWICNVDEFESSDQYVTIYSDAVKVSEETWDLTKQIGFNENMFLSQEISEVGILRPRKFVSLEYPFEYPSEIVNNIDFERGDLIGIISIPGGAAYEIDDWSYARHSPNGAAAATPADGSAYIVRMFEDGYEKERYVLINPITTTAPYASLKSDPVEIMQGDRITIGIDFRWASTFDAVNANPIAVELVADDGTYYYLHTVGKWSQYPVAGTQILPLNYAFSASNVDKTEWYSISVNSERAPKSGKIYVYINNRASGGSGINMYVQNLQLTYQPLINGSYMKYRSQEHRVTQDGTYAANISEDVHVSDGVKKLFKGALQHRLELGGVELDIWVLSDSFYAGHVYPLGLPGGVDPHPYGHMQAFSVWNQVNRQFRLFEVNVQGLDMETFAAPDLVNKYSITDNTSHTENKSFILLHFEMDVRRCAWKGLMVEVIDSTIAKDYAATKTFKYISDRS